MATAYEIITTNIMDLSAENNEKMLVWNNTTGKFDWIAQPTTIDNAVTSDSELFPQNSVIIGDNDGRKVTSTDLKFDNNSSILSGMFELQLTPTTATPTVVGTIYYSEGDSKLMVVLP